MKRRGCYKSITIIYVRLCGASWIWYWLVMHNLWFFLIRATKRGSQYFLAKNSPICCKNKFLGCKGPAYKQLMRIYNEKSARGRGCQSDDVTCGLSLRNLALEVNVHHFRKPCMPYLLDFPRIKLYLTAHARPR